MKIDIHTHTRKCKSGDAPTRNVSAQDFCEAVLSTDVKIIAITNHNVFDLPQYKEIVAGLGTEAQAWPGVELDIQESKSRGHLLVIVSPSLATEFSAIVELLTKESTPDNFTITIESVLDAFDELGPLYVAHYKQKQPSLSDEAITTLQSKTRNPCAVIKEVANSISAGIYISHGHASIYGSDLHNWADYKTISLDLPDLRLPVESFEHFCLLLKKDATTINTILTKKTCEELILLPFEDSAILKLTAYNDINIVFGPKGTGKSCILKAIAKHYNDKGMASTVYVSASDRLEELFDIKGRNLTINLNDFGINYCTNEIKAIREASEVAVTSLNNYIAHFSATTTNRNAKKILLKNLNPEEETTPKHEFTETHDASNKTNAFLQFILSHNSIKDELQQEEFDELTRILSGLAERLNKRQWSQYSTWKEVCFLNSAIDVFRAEIARKTGVPAKPSSIGFRDYAFNRIKIEIAVTEIIKSFSATIPICEEIVGSLGTNKGALEYHTEFRFQTGTVTDSAFGSFSGAKKGTQKSFAKQMRQIYNCVYNDNLFPSIAALNSIEEIENIKTVYELLLFNRRFMLDGHHYTPSSGEASMVMLQKELGSDKDIYILDEPERSLGNEYINDVIVPLIKDRARAGKKIFISTHDANIAVRTLPYCSVYRCHGKSGYGTYIGNPFSNNLVNPDDPSDQLDWKRVSMRTLEGGEEAFGERGLIYGND